jgi:hypothetical protein
MAKIEEATKEIERREQSVRRTALGLAKIAMFIAAFNRRATNKINEELEVKWLSKRTNELLSEISATPEETSTVFKYVKALPELDELLKNNPKDAQKAWDAIWKDIADEIQPVA